ncbi:mannonate dehydratase [Pedobacter arcticus]|uniref:mannonate dehydratase n=1 Tax=Pedobacter arcticus TaxID=752140 RepID=UPI00037F27F7|nr:mannonate dehydratase [Pedobacter arcticus]
MKLSFLFFGNKPDEKWALCRQMGIKYAIAKLDPELTGDAAPWELSSMKRSYDIFKENGFELIGFEGDQFDMNRIKFGLEGREEDVEKYCLMLKNMGKLGVKLLCYNFMAGIGWYRTNTALKERGDALVSGFSLADAEKLSPSKLVSLSEEKLWENYKWFLEHVLPAAEKANVKMALHPDDPPVSPLRGVSRIFINAANIRKALTLVDSNSHGLTFCQGTYTTMGENVKSLIHEFGSQQKIFFVHIRDVEGNASDFKETFHDNGPTNMVDMFKAYQNTGIDVPVRSDHVPTMAGENNEQHGYAMKGNLFGIGYMKGIMETLGIPQE